MDLFDRYLHAVRGFLPATQQDDVIRELREDLRSHVEDREAELGRPLSQAEQEQILKHWGHPWLLASRYQPKRQLVGPALFPFYWLALKVALGIALLVHVIATAVSLANGRPLDDAVSQLVRFEPFLMTFGWVTLVFAILDRSVLRLPIFTDWNPSSLPPVPKERTAPSTSCRIAEMMMTAGFLLWLAAVPRHQWLLFGPAWTTIELGPAWFAIHVPMLVLVSAGLVVLAIGLRHPEWPKLRPTTSIALDIATLALVVYLLKSPDDFIVARAAGGATESLAALLNRLTRAGLGIAVLVLIITTAVRTVRLINWPRVRGWSPGQG